MSTMMIRPDLEITQATWEWVARLILDLKIDEFHENCGAHLDKMVAVSEKMSIAEAMAMDLVGGVPDFIMAIHRNCLIGLRKTTNQLIGMLEQTGAADGLLTRTKAYRDFLDDNWDRWHSDVSPEAVEDLAQRIFHGAA